MIKIAVDAMGSDQAPAVEIDGAVQAAAQYGIPIVLVGQEDRILPFLPKHDTAGLSVEVGPGDEGIAMGDSAARAGGRKGDCSIS